MAQRGVAVHPQSTAMGLPGQLLHQAVDQPAAPGKATVGQSWLRELLHQHQLIANLLKTQAQLAPTLFEV